jgi:hypothetical protein
VLVTHRSRDPLRDIVLDRNKAGRCGRPLESLSPYMGVLSLPIYETYPLDDIAEALALMRSNQHFGKIVISIG